MTFTEESLFDFTLETEHDVPNNGLIKLTLPIEMRFPDELVES